MTVPGPVLVAPGISDATESAALHTHASAATSLRWAADGEGGRKRLELYTEQKAFRDLALSPRDASQQLQER